MFPPIGPLPMETARAQATAVLAGDLRGACSYPLSGSVVCCSQLTRLYCLAHLVVVYIFIAAASVASISRPCNSVVARRDCCKADFRNYKTSAVQRLGLHPTPWISLSLRSDDCRRSILSTSRSCFGAPPHKHPCHAARLPDSR